MYMEPQKTVKAFIFLTLILSFFLFMPKIEINKNIIAKDGTNKSNSLIALFSYSSLLLSFDFSTFFPSSFALQKLPNHHYSNNISISPFQNSVYQIDKGNRVLFYNLNLSSKNNYYILTNNLISFNNYSNNESKINNCNSTNNNHFNNRQNLVIPQVLPPKIVMLYNGTQYDTGKLSNYKYREGTSFLQLQMPSMKINANLPNNITGVIKDSCLGFLIPNYLLGLEPSSISINAYDMQGNSIKLLSNKEDRTSTLFKVNLNEGKYILLAVATWLPTKENMMVGYEEYKFLINVIGNK
jgi:hypothetical protein